MLEKAALKIAPATLPPATDVSTTEVDTVEGSIQRYRMWYRMPSRIGRGSLGQIHGASAPKAKPTSGKTTNVKA
jgi:hypothetical protein